MPARFEVRNMHMFPGISIYMNETEDRVYLHVNHIAKYDWEATHYSIIPDTNSDCTMAIVPTRDDISDDEYFKYYGESGARILIFLPEDYKIAHPYMNRCKEQECFVFLKKHLHSKEEYIMEQVFQND